MMTCNVQIPLDDIIAEVKKDLDLSKYVSTTDGTAKNLTLKGGITLDSATKQDLCEALSNCFADKHVQDFTLNDARTHLVLTLSSGETFRVSREELVEFIKPALQTVRGPAGPAGPAGPKGDKGDDGVAGARGPAGPAGELDLSTLPITTWNDGTTVLVRQDGTLKQMRPADNIFQEVGVSIAADKLVAAVGTTTNVEVKVTNSGQGTNTETDLVITKPAGIGYSLSGFTSSSSGATITRVNDLTYKIRGLQSGGTATVKFKVDTNQSGTFQFGASVNPNTALDMQSNNNSATLTLNALANTAPQAEVGKDCVLITGTYGRTVIPTGVATMYTTIAPHNTSIPKVVKKGSLQGTVIKLPEATTVVVREALSVVSNNSPLFISGDTTYLMRDPRLNVMVDKPNDNTNLPGTLNAGTDYTFASGTLTILKDISTMGVIVHTRGAGEDCRWQSFYLAATTPLSQRLRLSTTHTAHTKGTRVTGDGVAAVAVNSITPLDGLSFTGRSVIDSSLFVPSDSVFIDDTMVVNLTSGRATTFTVTASGPEVVDYFRNASSAGNIQVRGEGNTLHVTVLNTVNLADTLQVGNVKFQVV